MGMSYETIRVEGDGGVATIFLDRPSKLNALNATLCSEIIDAVALLSRADEVKVLIFAGSGERAFSAGADVREFASRTATEQREVMLQRRIYDVVWECQKPTIAAVRGYCLGGGAEVALSCDLRVADRSARFGQPEIRLGIIPGGGGTQRLTRLVGSGQAMRLSLTGDTVDAEEAYRIGLVEFLVDEGRCLEKARDIADRIGRWSSNSLRLVKESIRAALETSLSVGLERERELFLTAFASEDGREGVRAFIQAQDHPESSDRDSARGPDGGSDTDG